MNVYVVTGSSSGIGKAFAEYILENTQHLVLGVSRSNGIHHPRFIHIPADLSNIEELEKLSLEEHLKDNRCFLINNAGSLGPVGSLETIEPEQYSRLLNLNVVAPVYLMRLFLTQGNSPQMVINISSGAGKYPIEGWTAYCSSKAALDLATQVAEIEYPNTTFYSMAPGVVDTKMQVEIRNFPKNQFKLVDKFIGYHNNGELTPATEIAKVLHAICQRDVTPPTTVFSVRDL